MFWIATIANMVYLIAAAFYLPVLCFQILRQGKNRRGWLEKLCGPRRALAVGMVDMVDMADDDDDEAKPIWVHGVSLGEINAARGIVESLGRRFPDRRVLISTTTDTGYARACRLFGPERVFRYPLDFSWTVRRALRRIDPALIVLLEQEVWFNLATLAKRWGVPVCVVNGRLTARSCRRLKWLGPVSRRMFASLSWVGVQDAPTGGRFREVGVSPERVEVTGSVKWDTAEITDHMDGQEALGRALGIDLSLPFWVCGSTGPGEEAMLLEVFSRLRQDFPELQLALVPRKPERFGEVADLIARRGFQCVRRSQCPDGSTHALVSGDRMSVDRASVILGDTMGELRKFYALSNVVFVGRSLVAMGGSDPMEVAALGKPIVVGLHMENFALPTARLESAGALHRVADVDACVAGVLGLLRDPTVANRAGAAGQRVVRENQGATERTVNMLVKLVK